MIDFKEYVIHLEKQLGTGIDNFNEIFMKYMVDNKWFDITPVWQDEMLMIEPDDFQPYLEQICFFFENYRLTTEEKVSVLQSLLEENFPDTVGKLDTFQKEYFIPSGITLNLMDFLLKYLKKEIRPMSDEDISALLTISYEETPKQYGNILCSFLRWLKMSYSTRFHNDYFMSKRQDKTESSAAYDIDEYLELLYVLFNEDYIQENEMYINAAESKNYTDTWLFLSLHFICALRNSDLLRIHRPKLTMSPEQVLEKIRGSCFLDEDARLTLYSITWRLSVLLLIPNKTSKHSGISSIKFCVPESVEVHIGILLALAEAHRQIERVPDAEPFIRCISDYNRISKYMGDEIGALFLESNFRSRSANKSYLQSVYMLTDDVLGNDDEFNVKGYILAALARSHKGSYGDFAATTAVYLKDAKLSGLSPEFVARELFERGVLSFIPSMLLKMITTGKYNKLPVDKQTKLIQQLDMTPQEIEEVVTLSNKSRKQSAEILAEIVSKEESPRNTILQILHRIGNGNAVSKQNECLCLISAMKRCCPHSDRTNCIGCEYEISTKSTVFLIMSEYTRLLFLYNQTSDEKIKGKYRFLIKETILPAMDELFTCVQEQYGTDAMLSLEKILKEILNA